MRRHRSRPPSTGRSSFPARGLPVRDTGSPGCRPSGYLGGAAAGGSTATSPIQDTLSLLSPRDNTTGDTPTPTRPTTSAWCRQKTHQATQSVTRQHHRDSAPSTVAPINTLHVCQKLLADMAELADMAHLEALPPRRRCSARVGQKLLANLALSADSADSQKSVTCTQTQLHTDPTRGRPSLVSKRAGECGMRQPRSSPRERSCRLSPRRRAHGDAATPTHGTILAFCRQKRVPRHNAPRDPATSGLVTPLPSHSVARRRYLSPAASPRTPATATTCTLCRLERVPRQNSPRHANSTRPTAFRPPPPTPRMARFLHTSAESQ